MNNLLLAYAMDFSGFLVQNMEKGDLSSISHIILFGSVARGDASARSDVDIFVNTPRNLESKCKKILARFYKSELYKRYWKLMGIRNEIKLIVDALENWKDLKMSIIADGVILYGKYTEPSRTNKNYIILWWGSIKPEYKRILVSKQLYGWRLKNKRYEGLLAKIRAEKLGSNVILVPAENFNLIKELFKKHKIPHKLMYVSAIK